MQSIKAAIVLLAVVLGSIVVISWVPEIADNLANRAPSYVARSIVLDINAVSASPEKVRIEYKIPEDNWKTSINPLAEPEKTIALVSFSENHRRVQVSRDKTCTHYADQIMGRFGDVLGGPDETNDPGLLRGGGLWVAGGFRRVFMGDTETEVIDAQKIEEEYIQVAGLDYTFAGAKERECSLNFEDIGSWEGLIDSVEIFCHVFEDMRQGGLFVYNSPEKLIFSNVDGVVEVDAEC